jgi:hypothetical protein
MSICSSLVRSCALAALVVAPPQVSSAASIEPVSQAFQKLVQARSRSETTVTDDKGQVTHSRAEFDTFDRIHTVTDHGEFIVLPEGTWMKTGDNWTKPPVDMSGMIKRFLPGGDEVMRSAKNVSDDGMTTWQGQPVHAYSYDTDTVVMGAHAAGHSKSYINATGQIVGNETDSETRGKKIHSVQTVAYDDSIRVKAPL